MNPEQLDPKWTAYALGEVERHDAPMFEAHMAGDAGIREHVQQVRELAGMLSEAMRDPEPESELDATRQARILQRALVASASAQLPKATRIDLRARLGRASARGDARPDGIAPPPAIMGPPVAPSARTREPFAAVAAAEAIPEIRIELDESVIAAQKRDLMKLVFVAALAGAVGILAGVLAGRTSARVAAQNTSVEDARSLVPAVRTSIGEVEAIDRSLGGASTALYKENRYPEALTKELSQVEVSFTAAELGGKSLHRLEPRLMRMLFDYARDAQDLNARKQRLTRIFDARKVEISSLLAQAKEPRIGYSVVVQRDREGNAVGTFVPLMRPIEVDKKWPEELLLNTSKGVVGAERYRSGEPFGTSKAGRPGVVAIPVEPGSVAKVFKSPLGERISAELEAMNALIHGTQPGKAPMEEEKRGLLELGEEIVIELNAVGKPR